MKRIIRFIKEDLTRSERIGLVILLAGHLLAARNSFGFHHPDEHFQIFEFAHTWLGLSDPRHLPWEYGAQIRPWFQPLLHAAVMKLALLTGLYEPFGLATFFRAAYALLNIWALFALWRSFKARFALADAWWPVISAVWFFPYIHVRTSSENLSGIFLAFAFLQLWKPAPRHFRAGLLFGFAFLARYQIALGLAGLGLVLLIQARRIVLDHFRMLAGFLIPVALGIVLDRIGYGNWVLTSYRYFTVNLVQGVAATFNPYPWYQYFIWIAQLNPLVSLPLLVGWAMYLRRRPVDILSGFTFVFFFLHLFITNKEYRFLFPILNFVPFMTAVAFPGWARVFTRRSFWILYGLISVVSFYASAMRGASVHMLWPSHIYARNHTEGDHWVSNRDFSDLSQTAYYELKGIHLTVVSSGAELVEALRQGGVQHVIVDGKLEDQLTQDLLDVLSHACQLKDTSYPQWLFLLRDQFPIVRRLVFKAYYVCDMKSGA